MTEINHSRALVTGASGGLGRAIARRLSDEGAEVVVTGRRSDALAALAAEIGGRPVVADLAHRAELERLLDEVGPLDIAVFNAALPGSGELDGWDQADIDRVLEVNLGSPVAATRALLPQLQTQGRGHLVYISSLSGKVGTARASIYSATKFGLRGFAHALRCELAGSGIGCSVINPGFVRDAGMFADSGARLPPGVGSATPGQVADAVVRAIRRNRAEIDVAPVALRLGALVGSLAPGLSGAVQARLGDSFSRQMAESQRRKRA
jgi:short-subunit dehydrogenase